LNYLEGGKKSTGFSRRGYYHCCRGSSLPTLWFLGGLGASLWFQRITPGLLTQPGLVEFVEFRMVSHPKEIPQLL
jgi:hypothetical protein